MLQALQLSGIVNTYSGLPLSRTWLILLKFKSLRTLLRQLNAMQLTIGSAQV